MPSLADLAVKGYKQQAAKRPVKTTPVIPRKITKAAAKITPPPGIPHPTAKKPPHKINVGFRRYVPLRELTRHHGPRYIPMSPAAAAKANAIFPAVHMTTQSLGIRAEKDALFHLRPGGRALSGLHIMPAPTPGHPKATVLGFTAPGKPRQATLGPAHLTPAQIAAGEKASWENAVLNRTGLNKELEKRKQPHKKAIDITANVGSFLAPELGGAGAALATGRGAMAAFRELPGALRALRYGRGAKALAGRGVAPFLRGSASDAVRARQLKILNAARARRLRAARSAKEANRNRARIAGARARAANMTASDIHSAQIQRAARRSQVASEARASAQASTRAAAASRAAEEKPVISYQKAGRGRTRREWDNAEPGATMHVQSGGPKARRASSSKTNQTFHYSANSANSLAIPAAFSTAPGQALAQLPYQVGKAFATDKDVRRETWRGAKALPREFLPGLIATAVHPAKTLKAQISQYSKMYGPLIAGDTAAFRKGLTEAGSGGAIGPALDLAFIGGPLASRALGGAARGGTFGEKLQRIHSAERPDLQVSFAEGSIRRQRSSKRFVKRHLQHKRDLSRAEYADQEAKRRVASTSTDTAARVLQSMARDASHSRKEGYVKGTVTPRGGPGFNFRGRQRVVRLPGRLASDRRLQHKLAAQEGSRSIMGHEAERHVIVAKIEAALAKHPGKVQKIVSVAIQGGIKMTNSKETVLRQLGHRRREIVAENKARHGSSHPALPRGRRKQNDEIVLIDKLIARVKSGEIPTGADARELQGTINTVKRAQGAAERGDPALSRDTGYGTSQVQSRKYKPLVETLLKRDTYEAEAHGAERQLPDFGEVVDKKNPSYAEDLGTYINKVGLKTIMQAARKRGYTRPGFVRSEARFRERPSEHAVGGSRAPSDYRRFGGQLYRTGRQDLRPAILAQGAARTVKSKHKINRLARTAATHGLDINRQMKAEVMRRMSEAGEIQPEARSLTGRLIRTAEDLKGKSIDEQFAYLVDHQLINEVDVIKHLAPVDEYGRKAITDKMINEAVVTPEMEAEHAALIQRLEEGGLDPASVATEPLGPTVDAGPAARVLDKTPHPYSSNVEKLAARARVVKFARENDIMPSLAEEMVNADARMRAAFRGEQHPGDPLPPPEDGFDGVTFTGEEQVRNVLIEGDSDHYSDQVGGEDYKHFDEEMAAADPQGHIDDMRGGLYEHGQRSMENRGFDRGGTVLVTRVGPRTAEGLPAPTLSGRVPHSFSLLPQLKEFEMGGMRKGDVYEVDVRDIAADVGASVDNRAYPGDQGEVFIFNEDVRPVTDERRLAYLRVLNQGRYEMGRTLEGLNDDMSHIGFTVGEDWVPFNPGKFFAEVHKEGGTRSSGNAVVAEDAQFQSALDFASFTGKDLKTEGADFMDEKGWIAIPKAAWDEIQPNLEGSLGRGWDILKGKQSRILLGLGNVSWLGFQLGSNVLLSGMAGVGPIGFLKAQKWWSELPAEQRAGLSNVLGSQSHQADLRTRHLGASAIDNRVVSTYRGFQNSDLYHYMHKANVVSRLMDESFRFDKAQTAAFRRAVLYKEAKKEALGRMTADLTRASDLQSNFVEKIFGGKNLDEKINAILSNRKSLEYHAATVDEWLGDYTSFTARERHGIQRIAMFYGFLRHSLRLAFLTMPTRHPVMLGIMGKLALLSDKETRELLGVDDLPIQLAGYTYKSGKGIQQINIARGNPFGNFAFEIEHPSQILGVLPPIVSMSAAFGLGYNTFTGKAVKVDGQTGFDAANRPTLDDLSILNRIRVAARQIQSTLPPVRYADTILNKGPQGDDSLIFSPRATVYKDPKIKASIAREMELERKRGLLGGIGKALVPGYPTSLSPDYIQRIRELNNPSAFKRSTTKKPGVHIGGSSSGSGFNFGGSSGSTFNFGGK